MSTLKECTVVMLPTKDKSNIVESNDDILFYTTSYIPQLLHQHLYILSDDEIKGGDWYLLGKTIKQASNNIGKPDKDKKLKIIATTDKFLGLAEPSQGFIKKYCQKGGIDKVMVEYEKIGNLMGAYLQPKVSSDNTITIKPIKNSWKRKEVIQLLKDVLMDSHELTTSFPDGTTRDIISNEDALFNKGFEHWIKENL